MSLVLYYSLPAILNILFELLQKVTKIVMFGTTEIFLAINSIKKNEEKKPSKSNIYQHLQKDEKHKELGYATFDQVIENLLLSGTIFTKADPDSFYIRNGDVIIESFNDITLLRQDINERKIE